MGRGGGLVILPHKSWNVWNRDNRERVARDERKAREEEAKKVEKEEEEAQKIRIAELRARARASNPDTQIRPPQVAEQHASATDEPEYPPLAAPPGQIVVSQGGPTGGHINFFADIERGLKKRARNKDHEKEKKDAKEAEEKKIGIVMYLGQTVTDAKKKGKEPWYQEEFARPGEIPQRGFKRQRAVAKQGAQDPLVKMKEHVYETSKLREDRYDDKEKSKRKKVDRVMGRRRRSSESSNSRHSSRKSDDPMEVLRAAKRARERDERKKVSSLIAAAAMAQTPESIVPTTPRGYHTTYRHYHRSRTETPRSVAASVTTVSAASDRSQHHRSTRHLEDSVHSSNKKKKRKNKHKRKHDH